VSQPSVLIVADQSGFGRDLVMQWQMERDVPAFTVVSSELWAAAPAKHCGLAIVDGRQLAETRLASILDALERIEIATICVLANEARFHSVRSQFSRVMPIKHNEEWMGTVVVLGAEVLRRENAQSRNVGQMPLASHAHAVLGKFMLESRHAFNNALTSVLGNAELLMLENGNLPADMREQVETIHAMALRLHEMMQRFSSLEVEMQFAEKNSVNVPGAVYTRAAGPRELREEDPDLR
jgi:signal transduction histidine kinase